MQLHTLSGMNATRRLAAILAADVAANWPADGSDQEGPLGCYIAERLGDLGLYEPLNCS